MLKKLVPVFCLSAPWVAVQGNTESLNSNIQENVLKYANSIISIYQNEQNSQAASNIQLQAGAAASSAAAAAPPPSSSLRSPVMQEDDYGGRSAVYNYDDAEIYGQTNSYSYNSEFDHSDNQVAALFQQVNPEVFNTISEDQNGEEIQPGTRWTDADRPWTKTYSQFRRMAKMLLYGNLKLKYPQDSLFWQALGGNEIDSRFPKAINTLPKVLKEYGCWCMPRGDRDFSNGHGASVDDVDDFCKSMGHCLTCSQLSSECTEDTENQNYQTIDKKYDSKLVISDQEDEEDYDISNGKKLIIQCKDKQSNCLKNICGCHSFYLNKLTLKAVESLDARFQDWLEANDYTQTIDLSSLINQEYTQKGKYGGDFKFQESCKRQNDKQNEITHTPDMCCGDHPTWRLVDSQAGAAKCCGNRPYVTNVDTCNWNEKKNKWQVGRDCNKFDSNGNVVGEKCS